MSEREKNGAEYLQVITTVGTKEDASLLSRRLVESRAAACVQVFGPVESTYRWEGTVEISQEWQCFIKTERRHFSAVSRIIRENHPYEIPELIALPIVEGSVEYLRWISRETGKCSGGERGVEDS
jgi:periplasmic divalent cation tolerance protein